MVDLHALKEIRRKNLLQNKDNSYLQHNLQKGSNKSIFTTHEIGIIVSDISTGIEYLHKKDYIHRDIKPNNILIKLNGRIRRFGLWISHFN